MKSIKTLLLGCLFCAVALSACQKTEEKTDSSIANTTWAAAYNAHTLWIKFTSKSDFMEYMGDAGGNPASTGISYGTYSYSNNKVMFLTHDSTSPFDFATINNEVLTLTYKSGLQRTFIKK